MKKDRINGIISVIAGCLLVAGALRLPPSRVPDDIGPAIFPLIAAAMIMIPGIFLIVKKPSGEEKVFMNKEEWKRFLVLVLVFFAYAYLLWAAGFLIATPIVVFVISRMFSKGKKIPVWQTILYAVILAVFVYACFYKGLGLKMPRGEIFNLEF